jgi:DNA anti-recombination protein RmuC
MAISERERHRLHQSLDELMGPDVAAIMMSHLPPVGWADVATKHDLVELEGRLNNQLRASLAELRTELHTEIGSLRSELHTELGTLSSELHSAIATLSSELHTEIGTLRSLMHTELGDLSSELHGELGTLRSETHAGFGRLQSDLHAMTRTYVLGNIALVLSVVAIMFGVDRLL